MTSIEFRPSIHEIPRADWQSLAAGLPQALLQWDFLALLEDSGSACAATGWQAAHFCMRDESGLVAAAPLYIRSDSWGDFVFDQAFAQAVEQAGLPYYPKLVGTIPFSPVAAWRIMTRPGSDRARIWERFDQATRELCEDLRLAGRHLLWVDPEAGLPVSAGEPFYHQVFEWHNHGYAGFGDFLARFDQNQRKNIRRERAKARSGGLEVAMLDGESAEASVYAAMGELYQRTNDRFGPWAARFLSPEFFAGLRAAMAPWTRFAGAWPGQDLSERPLALALVFEKDGLAWGRYWGAYEERDSLHFELCYYLPQQTAIERAWRRFDPGMGGEHKLRRGFVSVNRPSWHWARDPRVHGLYQRYLPRFNQAELEKIDAANRALPWRNAEPGHETVDKP